MPDAVTLTEIAELFRVTPAAARLWVKAGLPVVAQGKRGRGSRQTKVSLRAAVEWYFTKNFERLELDRQRARLASEQSLRLEMQNATSKGQLLRAEDVVQAWSRVIHVSRARILQIPNQVMRFVGAREAEIARGLVNEALTELSQEISYVGESDGRNTEKGVQASGDGDHRPGGGAADRAARKRSAVGGKDHRSEE